MNIGKQQLPSSAKKSLGFDGRLHVAWDLSDNHEEGHDGPPQRVKSLQVDKHLALTQLATNLLLLALHALEKLEVMWEHGIHWGTAAKHGNCSLCKPTLYKQMQYLVLNVNAHCE